MTAEMLVRLLRSTRSTVEEGKLSTLDGFRETRVEGLLDGVGRVSVRALLKLSREKFPDIVRRLELLEHAKADVLHITGERALVRVSYAEGSAPEEVAFIKIDECWVPKELDDQWQVLVPQWRRAISEFDLDAAKKKLARTNATLKKVIALLSDPESPKLQRILESILPGD